DHTWDMFFIQIESTVNAILSQVGIPAVVVTKPAKGTGIYKDWLARYKTKGQNLGPALGFEVKENNWDGQPIAVQQFVHARCEYTYATNVCSWYNANGKLP